MTLAGLLIGVIWAGVTVYAILGGADFGAGVLHLFAPAGLAGRRRRAAITAAMGPVWEANHVWLIFVLTGLLTAFPAAFAALGTALLAPGTLVLVGIVVRGAALAFVAQLTAGHRGRRPLELAFGLASAGTPLMLGAIAGGLARQRLRVEHGAVRTGGGLALWLGPFQLAVGLLAVAVCTALAACSLTIQARRGGQVDLAYTFRAIAGRAAALSVVLALAALVLAAQLALPLFHGLTGRGLPAVLVAVLGFAAAAVALSRRRDRSARAALVIATAALVWGWGLAQYPRLVGTQITVATAAASAPELQAIAIALAVGGALLLPALWLLHRAFRRHCAEAAR